MTEQFNFILDGLSVGEDKDVLCRSTEPPLCTDNDYSHDEFLQTVREKQKEKEEQEAKKKKKEL